MKRWIHITESKQGATRVTSSLVITQRQASDLVRKHVKGVAGLRVEADSKVSFAKHAGEPIRLTANSRLEYQEWP